MAFGAAENGPYVPLPKEIPAVKPQYTLAASLAAIVSLLDQITKYQVQKHIPLGGSIDIFPSFFNLVHTLNRGAAFGFLNRQDTSWQTYFFIGATALALVIIGNLLSKTHSSDKLSICALGLILGGALGNLADRIRTGEVVDFLDFFAGSWHWPAFNIADIAITVGSLALIVSFYRRGKHNL